MIGGNVTSEPSPNKRVQITFTSQCYNNKSPPCSTVHAVEAVLEYVRAAVCPCRTLPTIAKQGAINWR